MKPSATPIAHSVDSTDPTPLESTSQINVSDVPEFERPTASTETLSTGQMDNTAAYVDPDKPNNIVVAAPNRYTAATQAHELTHSIQNQAGSNNVVNVDPAKMKTQADVDSVYGYGGTDGLDKVMKSGGIAKLNNEQQASIPQNYMKEFLKAEQSGDAGAIDKLNKVYEPAIRQLRNMANPSKDTIDTTPDAPGAPPASVTGVAVPVKGMLSNATKSVALKASDVHNPPPKTDVPVSKYNTRDIVEAIAKTEGTRNPDGSPSTAARFNNPTNLKATAAQIKAGAPYDKKTGFRIFPSREEGVKAAIEDIETKKAKNPKLDIATLASKWAPTSDGNDPKGKAAMMARMLTGNPKSWYGSGSGLSGE